MSLFQHAFKCKFCILIFSRHSTPYYVVCSVKKRKSNKNKNFGKLNSAIRMRKYVRQQALNVWAMAVVQSKMSLKNSRKSLHELSSRANIE